MPTIKLHANGYTIATGGATLNFSNAFDNVARAAAMRAANAMDDADVAKPFQKAADMMIIAKPFWDLQKVLDRRSEIMTSFGDYVAHNAEKVTHVKLETPALLAKQSSAAPATMQQIRDAWLGEIRSAVGTSYTGFYADLRGAEMMLGVGGPLDIDAVDFDDVDSVNDYFKTIQDYAQKIHLRDHVGWNNAEALTGEQELMILMHTENREVYGAYISRFEQQISANFQRELRDLQNYARDLGFTGDVTNVKQLKAFENTLSGADKYQMHKLIDATTGKANKVDQFILGRIRNGDIDIHKIIATGQFNGVNLDAEAQAAFKALAVYANTDALALQYHNEILQGIGHTSKVTKMDFNNHEEVAARIKEFEAALSKAGYGVIEGYQIEQIPLDKLRTADTSHMPDEVRKAISQYTALREHANTLKEMARAKAGVGRSGMMITRKLLGDSDISRGIGQTYSMYHNVKFALKMAHKADAFLQKLPVVNKVYKAMRSPVAKAYHKAGKFIKAHTKTIRSYIGKSKRASSGGTGSTRKPTKLGELKSKISSRYSTHEAKKMEHKLIREAGKQANPAQNVASNPPTTNFEITGGTQSGTLGTGAAPANVTNASNAANTANAVNAANAANAANTVNAVNVSTTVTTTSTTAASGAAAGGAATGGAAASGAAAGGAGAAAGGGAAGGAAAGGAAAAGGLSAGMVLVIILLIVAVLQAFFILLSSIMMPILESLGELDNTLIGKIANFIANWKWPWEDQKATPEDQQNTLMYTVYTLQDEEAKAKDVTTQLQNMGDFNCGYYAEKQGDVKTKWTTAVFPKDAPTTEGNQHFIFLDAQTKDPINEYSQIKLVISMAHAFTYHIEMQSQLENFSIYATGLWHYLNTTRVEAKLLFCPANCNGKYTYYCNVNSNDTPFYKNIVNGTHYHMLTDNEKANGIAISPNNPKVLYIWDGKIVPAKGVDRGCIQYIYDARQGTQTKNDSNTGLSSTSFIDPVHLTNNAKWLEWWNKENGKENHGAAIRHTGIYDKDGKEVVYDISPNAAQECFSDYDNNHPENFTIQYCSGSNLALCNNTKEVSYTITNTWTEYVLKFDSDVVKEIQTKDGIQTYSHWETTPNTHQKVVNYYHCDGCEGTLYDSDTQVITFSSITYNASRGVYEPTGSPTTLMHVVSVDARPTNCSYYKTYYYYDANEWAAKEDKTTLNGITRHKYYVCWGHEGIIQHGDFDASHNNYKHNLCKNFIPQTGYEDVGYSVEIEHNDPVTQTVTVCKGHLVCSTNHYTCEGHTISPCSGHIAYTIIRETISSDSDAVFSDEWDYEIPDNFLWIDTSKKYKPKKPSEVESGIIGLAREDWQGWDDNAKTVMKTLYASDWYLKYGFGLSSFKGAQISPSERSELLKAFNVTQSDLSEAQWNNLTTAFDSIGKIPYFPGDKAEYPGYDERNHFNETVPAEQQQFDSNGVLLGVHGLDPAYYADWVHCTSHNGSHSSTLSNIESQTSGFRNRVASLTRAGTPIVFVGAGKIRTGILIGCTDAGMITYVGVSEAGWTTIMTEPVSSSDGTWFYSFGLSD